MYWTVSGLPEQLQVSVIDGVGEIDHVVENGGERSFLQDPAHAHAGVFKEAAQHLEGDRIEGRLLERDR